MVCCPHWHPLGWTSPISPSSLTSRLYSWCPGFHNGLQTPGIEWSLFQNQAPSVSTLSLSISLPHGGSEDSFLCSVLISPEGNCTSKAFPRPIHLYPSPTIATLLWDFLQASFPRIVPGKARSRLPPQWDPTHWQRVGAGGQNPF